LFVVSSRIRQLTTDNLDGYVSVVEKQIPPLRYGMTNKRTGNSNDKSKDEMRGFFAALRMTDFLNSGLGFEEELAVAHNLFFAVGVA
jgi:hypothetical protein